MMLSWNEWNLHDLSSYLYDECRMEFTSRGNCAQCEHATTLTSYCVDLEDSWFSIQLKIPLYGLTVQANE